MNRWMVVVGAILVQLCLGAIYAWSVFTPTLKKSVADGGGGWSNLQTQIVFSVGLALFAIVMVLAGRRLATWGPQRLAIMGGLILGAGYVIAGIGGGMNFWMVLIGVGILGGSGIGLGYVVPIAVGMRWFPDRKGMITGAAVAGFGFGALGWVKIADSWGNLLANLGIGTTFMIYGAAFTAIVLLGSIWLRMPPEGWLPAGYTPPAAKVGSGGEEFSAKEMLRTPQFHLIAITFFVSAGAGLMAIGLMKLWPIQALTETGGLEPARADAIAGTAMAVFFSLANGIGRLAWGAISDRLGRKNSVVVMAASQGILLFLFIPMASSEWLLYLGAALIGFNFGGNFSLFPSMTADTFGNATVGRNYPWVFLAYGAGGIVFPNLGGWLGDLGNFPLAFTICGIACLAGAVATFMVFPPSREEAAQPFTVGRFLGNANLFDRKRLGAAD